VLQNGIAQDVDRTILERQSSYICHNDQAIPLPEFFTPHHIEADNTIRIRPPLPKERTVAADIHDKRLAIGLQNIQHNLQPALPQPKSHTLRIRGIHEGMKYPAYPGIHIIPPSENNAIF
jgi:hypothetical protein